MGVAKQPKCSVCGVALPVGRKFGRCRECKKKGARKRFENNSRLYAPNEKRDIEELRATCGLPPLPKATIRPCLRCEKPFKSDGPSNRLCPICTNMVSRKSRAHGDDLQKFPGQRNVR